MGLLWSIARLGSTQWLLRSVGYPHTRGHGPSDAADYPRPRGTAKGQTDKAGIGNGMDIACQLAMWKIAFYSPDSYES